ncbi:MAG TPA: hypothetical protein VLE23_11135 [Geminicoccaceae bacterium]|nr:hypothetical protein [Geminicoccaceae bacterium]
MPPANLAREEQEGRRIRHPWEAVVFDWLDNPLRAPDIDGIRKPIDLKSERVTTAMILEHAIMKPIERRTRADEMTIAASMKRFGWKMQKGHRDRRWVPTTTSERKWSQNETNAADLGRKSRGGLRARGDLATTSRWVRSPR